MWANVPCRLQGRAAEEDRTACKSVIAEDEVRELAIVDRSDFVCAADLARGDQRCGRDSLFAGDAEGDSVFHAVVEIRGAAGDGAVRKARHAAGEEDLLSAEHVLPVRHTAAAQRIGDEADAPGEEPERHAHGTGMNMMSVADEFGDNALPLRGCADGPGFIP